MLAIYRGRLNENRGTPIRVRSILERLAKDGRMELMVATWDEALPFNAVHIRLSNRKFSDARALFDAVRKNDVRVVMGHTMATWYYLLFLKAFTRAKIALEMHGFIEIEARFYGSMGLVRYAFDRAAYRVFYALCDLITTCSENAAEILRRYNKHVVTVYGGVDTRLFDPGAMPGRFFLRSPNDIVIGYSGNMRKWQGVSFLVEAFKKLHAEDPSFKLAVLSSEKKNVPFGDGITIVGEMPHERVPSFLAACDILVVPRLVDAVSSVSFPSKLPEYLAMGKPVIASATSDAHRVITDGENGLLFPPGDTSALISVMRELRDPTLRERLGKAARNTAEERFSWKRQVALVAESILAIV